MPIWLIVALAFLFVCLIVIVVGGLRVLIKSLLRDESKDPEYLEHYTTDGRLRKEAFPGPK